MVKQSPGAWFAKFSGLLSAFGFISCAINIIMLTKKTKDSLVILAVYMDDTLLAFVTLVFILPIIIYSNILVSVTWGVQDTFLGSSFYIKRGS